MVFDKRPSCGAQNGAPRIPQSARVIRARRRCPEHARRLDGANRVFIHLKNQLEAGQSRSVVAKTVEKMGELLGSRFRFLQSLIRRCSKLLKHSSRRTESVSGNAGEAGAGCCRV